MSVVDDDEISLGIESRAPGFSWRSFKGVARKALRRNIRRAHRVDQFVCNGNQGFCFADCAALLYGYVDSGKARFIGRVVNHRLVTDVFEITQPLGYLPLEFQILFHTSS